MRSNCAMFLANLSLLLGIAGFVGCTEPNPFYDPPVLTPCEAGRLVMEPFKLANPWQVDILFVVDNSYGMLEAQQALGRDMPGLVRALNAIEELDYRLGVISTEVDGAAAIGALQTGMNAQPGCPGDRPRFISRDTLGGPSVAACNVVLGEDGEVWGSGFSSLHEALSGAVTRAGGANEGFLRPNSRVVAVIFSNKDDCWRRDGLEPQLEPADCVHRTEELVQLSELVAMRRMMNIRNELGGTPVDLVVIVGPSVGRLLTPPDPPPVVCSANGDAHGGRRYIEAADMMGERGGFYSICTRGYSEILLSILEEHIRPRADLLCPQLDLSQPPVLMRLSDGQDSRSSVVWELPEGVGGWRYLGPVEGCEPGLVALSPQSLGMYGADEEVQLFYCTEAVESPSGL